MHEYLLSLAIWVPVVAGVIVLINKNSVTVAKYMGLTGAIISFVVTLPLYGLFGYTDVMQFVENYDWISTLNIRYHLGVDGLSVLFIILNSFTTLLVIIAGWQVIKDNIAQYFAAFLIMSGMINGAFAAQDAILFYVFFEAMLIPMYLIIGIWGGPRRVYAAIKFFLYTLLGSLLMLVALIYLSTLAGGSFEISDFHAIKHISLNTQILLFVAFFLSFAVKVPMWPVHTWLPDAHVEAPTGGSMILAAITLKIGAYGFLRFALPILPDAIRAVSPYMIVLSLIGIVYIGLIALVQRDMKKLVAYSSISHMGMVTLGLFLIVPLTGSLNSWALQGAIMQMLSHGFVSAAMFMCIGVLYDRLHSREVADYGGVASKMPVFATLMMLFAMANAGLPLTSGFVGEFMVIMGAVQINIWIALIAATTLIVGAAYTLWLYKRVIFGAINNPAVEKLTDLNCRERVVLFTLALAVLAMGLYPKPFIKIVEPSAQYLIKQVFVSKAPELTEKALLIEEARR